MALQRIVLPERMFGSGMSHYSMPQGGAGVYLPLSTGSEVDGDWISKKMSSLATLLVIQLKNQLQKSRL